nr:dipeptide epimerase [Acanthopleuribacter pedis]
MNLEDTFAISRWHYETRENLVLRIRHQGVVGYGEAAPNRRYGESLQSAQQALPILSKTLGDRPEHFYHRLELMQHCLAGQGAVKAALDMALFDWLGKTLSLPVHRYFGFDPAMVPATSFTLGIAEPDKIQEKARKGSEFPFLKIKLSGEVEKDREMVRALRQVTQQPLLVDVNEAWNDPKSALNEIYWLADQGVMLIEQPMPSASFEDLVWLKPRSPLPLFADESLTEPRDVVRLAEAFHGINVKIMKVGGLAEARRALETARLLGMQTMLGCMIESGLGIAAAAQLAPMVDWTDLDGNLLLAEDPCEGLVLKNSQIQLSDQPGLGVSLKPEILENLEWRALNGTTEGDARPIATIG